jgi:hypothetical protein
MPSDMTMTDWGKVSKCYGVEFHYDLVLALPNCTYSTGRKGI